MTDVSIMPQITSTNTEIRSSGLKSAMLSMSAGLASWQHAMRPGNGAYLMLGLIRQALDPPSCRRATFQQQVRGILRISILLLLAREAWRF